MLSLGFILPPRGHRVSSHAERDKSIAAYEPYLRERWQAGCQNARQRWREVHARGFTGGHETVRRLIMQWRTEPGRPGLPRRQPPATPPPASPLSRPSTRPRSPRQARWLLVKPTDMLRPAQQAYLHHPGARCPAILVGQGPTTTFQRLVRERDHPAPAPWLVAADASGLPEFVEFATGIDRDRAAVEAALTTAWSTGQTEARVLQRKAVRRQLRGRGGVALVRCRVVTAA